MKSSRSALPIWGLPPVGLAGLLWLSLFGFSPIPIAPLEALQALLAPKKPSLAQALVLNLRLPRSLALSGALLQILTHNPLASPSLLGINSGAALAMLLTSAFSPVPLASYSLAFIAACGGGVSWLLVMAAGGGWRQEARMKMRIACLLLALLALNVTSLLMGAVPLLFRISVAKSAKVSLPFFQADNR